MSFLSPFFLLGALAAAVPILLHLRRRERRNVIVFPSLMFLRGSPPPDASRRRLDNLLLLALRVGVVLLLAFAFARPVLERVLPEGFLAGGRDVVLVLDISPSMNVGDRIDAMRTAALRELEALGGGDRAAIVAFSDRAAALTDLTGDHGLLQGVLRNVATSGGATRYAPALHLASRLLADGQRSHGTIVLIGDLQNVGWSPAENGVLPAGTELRVVPVGGEAAQVDRPTAVGFTSAIRVDRELASVELRSPAQREWVLEVDGREAGRAAGEGGVATFPALPLPERPVRARIPLATGGPDDAMRLVLERHPLPEVAVVRPAGSGGDGFLTTALRASDSPPIKATVWRGALPPDRDLAGIPVLVLDGVSVGSGDAERLLQWVQNGGGLVLSPGPDASDLPAPLASAAGLSRGSEVQRATGTIASVDASHPAFAGARRSAAASLPGTSVFRYHRLSPASNGEVLVRADDGSPLLLEQPLGRGRILTWASTFDDRWNALVRHPGFVPLAHGIVLRAMGAEPPPPWLESGEAVDLAALIAARSVRGTPPADGEVLTLALPNGDREEVAVAGGSAVARLSLPGFYEVRRGRGSESALVLAVNVPAAEWNLERLMPDDVAQSVVAEEEMSPQRAVLSPVQAREDVEREQRLWWWALLAAGLMLAAEGALANRLARPHVSTKVNGGGAKP